MRQSVAANHRKQRACGFAIRHNGRAKSRFTLHSHPPQAFFELGFMLHPRGNFLPHIAALAEIHPVEALKTRLQNVGLVLDQLRLGDDMLYPQRFKIVFGQSLQHSLTIKPPAHGRMARVGKATLGCRANAAPHGALIGLYLHISTQPIHGEPLRQRGRAIRRYIEQHPVADLRQKEVKHILPLRAQQRRIYRPVAQFHHIIRHQPLQKALPVTAGNPQQLPRFIMVSFGHVANIGARPANTSPKAPMPAPISVIIPTLNAAATISPTLAALAEGLDAGLIGELIIVDGGSEDAIETIADDIGARFEATAPSRGGQLSAGAALATRPWLLFVHADTVLGNGWLEAVQAQLATPEKAGYFRLRFDATGLAPRLVAGWANLRSRRFGLPYGDQALLISATLYAEVGGHPDQPLMEDVALARALKSKLTPLNADALTSAAKYQGQWLRRGRRNLGLLLRYFLGASPETLSRRYRN